MRKRFWLFPAVWILVLTLLVSALSFCFAETYGFGIVNDTDVALRENPGGKKLTRLPKDTCVWIRDTRTDGDGSVWYEVSAG